MKKISLCRLLERAARNLADSEIAIMHLMDKFENGEITAAAARRTFRGPRGLWNAFVIDANRFNNLINAIYKIDAKAAQFNPVDLTEMGAKYFDYFVY